MRSNFVPIFIGIILILNLSVVFGAKKNMFVFNGKIGFFTGDVTVNGQPAKIDAPVLSGSIVKTGKDSECEIIFNEKNIIHIIENSEITLDITETHKILNINSGGIACILKNLNPFKKKNNSAFIVETAVSVASVRGTTFFIKAEDETNTYICDCNGIVNLSGKNGTNITQIKSSHHKAFRYTKTDSGITYEPAGLLYHNDQTLDQIAGKIGVKIDWAKVDKGK